MTVSWHENMKLKNKLHIFLKNLHLFWTYELYNFEQKLKKNKNIKNEKKAWTKKGGLKVNKIFEHC